MLLRGKLPSRNVGLRVSVFSGPVQCKAIGSVLRCISLSSDINAALVGYRGRAFSGRCAVGGGHCPVMYAPSGIDRDRRRPGPLIEAARVEWRWQTTHLGQAAVSSFGFVPWSMFDPWLMATALCFGI